MKAIIIKGNPFYTRNDKRSDNFYAKIEKILLDQGYCVTVLEPDGADPVSSDADLYVGHSMGTEKLSGLPRRTRKIKLGVKCGIFHPLDNCVGVVGRPRKDFWPNDYHYIVTDEMLKALTSEYVIRSTSNDNENV